MYALKNVLYIRKHTVSSCQDNFIILNKKQNIYLLAYASKKIFIFFNSPIFSYHIFLIVYYTIQYLNLFTGVLLLWNPFTAVLSPLNSKYLVCFTSNPTEIRLLFIFEATTTR